eukprot:TRINITY_DN12069_c0_g1_i2.p1 TRINITY_DN12069_c0_g1~~TRINITY_DN12069_c0_g1_i2.p1  ORF type:complete len:342 (-),score=58.12 TRINITY_DN12069_c0_g1_i2:195-1070(-)
MGKAALDPLALAYAGGIGQPKLDAAAVAQEHLDAPVLTDAAGRPLCSHALWGRRCRWRKTCSFSHAVPPGLQETLALQAAAQSKRCEELRLAQSANTCLPDWLRQLQAATGAFAYDTRRWPLQDALAQVLGCSPAQMASLHTRILQEDEPLPLCPTLLNAYAATLGRAALPPTWQEALHQPTRVAQLALHRSEAHQHFVELYRDFCAHVILPLLEVESAYVQDPPSLRVHLAGQAQAQGRIGMHKDADRALTSAKKGLPVPWFLALNILCRVLLAERRPLAKTNRCRPLPS